MSNAAGLGSAVVAVPHATIKRVSRFCAAHRLHSKHLSDEENRAVFGKCNNPHYHGHNYRLVVFVRGPVCPKTGMVANLTDLCRCIDECVLARMDHRNLDIEVEFFKSCPSTTENVAHFIFSLLEEALPSYLSGTCWLDMIELWETDNNCVEVRRGDRAPSVAPPRLPAADPKLETSIY